MGWARFDDAYTDHPKVVTAGPLAELLDMRAILFSARYETDGHIPPAQLSRIGVGITAVKKRVAALVEVERWHEPGHKCKDCPQITAGWMVHDYLAYNPTRESKEAERAAARERMRKAREAKQGANEAGSSDDVRANTDRTSEELQECSDNPDPAPQNQNNRAPRADILGPPTTADHNTTLATTLYRWFVDRGERIEPHDQRSDDYRRLLALTGQHHDIRDGPYKRIAEKLCREYVADVTGEELSDAAVRHMRRIIGQCGGEAALEALAKAVTQGAGLDGKWALDERALSKYAGAILSNQRKAAS